MAKFQVPAEMAPGVARHLYGFFVPGEIFVWPENAASNDNPSLKLLPLDVEAYALLVKVHGESKVKAKHGPGPVVEVVAVKVDERKTGKQLAAEKGTDNHKRAADR